MLFSYCGGIAETRRCSAQGVSIAEPTSELTDREQWKLSNDDAAMADVKEGVNGDEEMKL